MTAKSGPSIREYRDVDVSSQEWGSDFIADLLKAYGFEHITFNPGASFRGIEESIVNYNDNTPEVIETVHEGLAVSIAHGHAKATGEPALCILHDVVGTMHGAMSVFNAYADQVPLLLLSGTGPMRKTKRRPWIDWVHTALVQGNIVREYVKWDDQPFHVTGVTESIVRAHKIADTPPKGPTYVTLDHDVQECALDEPIPMPDLEQFEPPTRMGPDSDAIEEAADLLTAADLPVILADQVGDTREGVDALVDLAETLGAAFVDPRKRRFNFPNTHPLDLTGTGIYRDADVVLAVDVRSVGYITKDSDSITHEITEGIEGDYQLVEIGLDDIGLSSLTTDYYALDERDLSILADSALALPELVDACERHLEEDDARRERARERSATLAKRHHQQRESWQKTASDRWDETPISPQRLVGEVWDVIRDEEWVLVSGTINRWTHRLWEIDEFDQYTGGDAGGAGVGYGIGGAIGGALAYADTDRVPINLQSDGDLMAYLGGLWTIGHYDIPLFTVVHNNKSLYNSTSHRMQLAEYRGRDASFERALIGTGLWNPVPDYAAIAESMGVVGYGPVEDPDDLGETLADAWETVKEGKPVLVDVVSQPR